MKLFAVAAAGLVALTGTAPGFVAPAAAQHTVVRERTVVRTGPGRAWHSRRECSWQYRHHHKVRTCRTVRYR